MYTFKLSYRLKSLKFSIQNGLKQEDALSQLILNFALENAIRGVQESQGCYELNGTHRLLVCAGDINLSADNISILKANAETL